MFSKYIHTLKFKVGTEVYTAVMENDFTHEELSAANVRLKAKIFDQIHLEVISLTTQERMDDSNRNQIEYRGNRPSIIPGERIGSYQREGCELRKDNV